MPITVDPSQVQSITVDPSQVSSAGGGAPEAPQGSAVSRYFGNLWHKTVDGFVQMGQNELQPFVDAYHAAKNGDGAGLATAAARIIQNTPQEQIAQGVIHGAVDQFQKAQADTATPAPDVLGRLGQAASHVQHLAAAMVPMAGPSASDAVDQMKSGDVAGGLGSATSLALQFAAPELLERAAPIISRQAAAVLRNPDPVAAADNAFASQAGIQVPAGTASGNRYVAATQALADSSPLGSFVANQAKVERSGQFARAGEQLAGDVSPEPTTPLSAGDAQAQALADLATKQHRIANTNYEALRELEADPANLKTVQVGTQKQTVPGTPASTLLDESGNPATPAVPASVQEVPVMGQVPLPVDLAEAQRMLQPVMDNFKRGMPVSEQRASKGLLAIQNILDAPRFTPASVVERDLGTIKGFARGAVDENFEGAANMSQGLAGHAVSVLEKAVQDAVSQAKRTPGAAVPASATPPPLPKQAPPPLPSSGGAPQFSYDKLTPQQQTLYRGVQQLHPDWDAARVERALAFGLDDKGVPFNANSTGAGGGEGAAVSGSAPGAQGSPGYQGTGETRITVPGSAVSYPASYALRELGDIQASHNGQTFQPNPNYVGKNERNYNDPNNRVNVTRYSARPSPGEPGFDPSYHITDNADATNGPVVTDAAGNALGGNGRKMILDRVYANNPEGAAAYKAMLKAKAAQFGIDPAAVDAMKQPVLTRVIPDSVFDQPGMSKANAIGDFNKSGTAALTPAERAIADSRRVSPQTLDDIGGRLDAAGPNATLSSALNGQAGVEVLHNLIGDGVVSMQERANLANSDGLTSAGKQRIASLVSGRFFSDPATMDSIPASVRAKVERAAAPLARVDGVAGWDLTPDMREAMDLVNEAHVHGAATIDDYINQSGLFGDQAFSPKAVALAKAFTETATGSLLKGAKQYAGDSAFAAGGDSMFGDGVDAAKAFTDAFGGDESTIRATPAAVRVRRSAASPAATTPSGPAPVDAGAEALAALKNGRAATAAKYDAILAKRALPLKGAEGVKTFGHLLQANDAGVAKLKSTLALTPEMRPVLGRALIEKAMAQAVNEKGSFVPSARASKIWEDVGPETKKALFPAPMIPKLDSYFRLMRRMSESVNPSGSATTLSSMLSGGAIVTHPMTAIPAAIGLGGLSKLMHSPAGLEALTTGLKVGGGKGAASTMAAARIMRLAAPQQLPAAAQNVTPQQNASK